LNGEATRVRKKQSSAIIASDVRRFGHVIRMEFSVHTGLELHEPEATDIVILFESRH
jgi:hypothetical protein